MKVVESQVPATTSQIEARCIRSESLPQPKTQMPMKVDSSMKAINPSSASVEPKTSPTNCEYDDQFIPNWNSCSSPVAAPIAKLISSSVPKNFVRRSHDSSRVRYHFVCM